MLLGVMLLNRQPPVYILSNRYTPTNPPTANTKRAVPLEIQYEQTPAAFEGFITKTRAERAVTTAVEGT